MPAAPRRSAAPPPPPATPPTAEFLRQHSSLYQQVDGPTPRKSARLHLHVHANAAELTARLFPTDDAAAAARSRRAPSGGRFVTALYDCEAEEDGELCFTRGDRIQLLDDTHDEGWWRGELNGHVGLFPSNFARADLDAPQPPQPAQAEQPRKSARLYRTAFADARALVAALPDAARASSGRFALALYDCQAEEDGELCFSKADRITLLDTSHEGWWKGELAGRIGLFPANYVSVE